MIWIQLLPPLHGWGNQDPEKLKTIKWNTNAGWLRLSSLFQYTNKVNAYGNRSKRLQGKAVFALFPWRIMAWFIWSPATEHISVCEPEALATPVCTCGYSRVSFCSAQRQRAGWNDPWNTLSSHTGFIRTSGQEQMSFPHPPAHLESCPARSCWETRTYALKWEKVPLG